MRERIRCEQTQDSMTIRLITVCTAIGVFLSLLGNTGNLAFAIAESMSTLLVVAVVYFVAGRHADSTRGPRFGTCFLLLLAWPFVADAACRTFLLFGLPMEAVTTCAVRNIALVGFTCPRAGRSQFLVIVASLMAMTSIYLQSFGVGTSIVTLAYTVLCIFWLMGWHWSKFTLKAANASQRMVPYTAKLFIVGTVALSAVLSGLVLRTSLATNAIAGWMPSSGGNRTSDPFAFGGVGDGDQMVGARDSAQSIGPIESELFLESTMPSIYDVFNDLYQEPTKRPKSMARAIPLAPNEMKSNHQRLATNESASREFSAIRRASKDRPKRSVPEDIQSEALFFVEGRVPVHLKHQVYDHWDGTTLSFEGRYAPRPLSLMALEESGSTPWASWKKRKQLESEHRCERHVLRIARLGTRRVPSPIGISAVSLDRLNSAQFFEWTDDGVIRFAGGKIPRMTVLHTMSHPPRLETLERCKIERLEIPSSSTLHPQVSRLQQQWTANATTDWERIEAIVEGLKATCRLDRNVSFDETSEDVVAAFLVERKRGPDFVFAIAAARLLREAGYQTRVVSGFYAHPTKFDRQSDQTAILPEDVHFWTEVKVANETWATVDACPGYEVQYARLSAAERLAGWIGEVYGWISAYQSGFLLCIVVIGLTKALRWRIRYVLVDLWFRLPLLKSQRALARSSLAVIEAYARLRNDTRPPQRTIEAWLRDISNPTSKSEVLLAKEYQRVLQWAFYSAAECPLISSDLHRLCRDFVEHVRRSGHGNVSFDGSCNGPQD